MNSLVFAKCVRLLNNTTVLRCFCKRSFFTGKTLTIKRQFLPVNSFAVNVNRPFTIWDIQRFAKRFSNPKTVDLLRKDQLRPDEYTLIYRSDFLTSWGWLISHAALLISMYVNYLIIRWYFEEKKTEEEILNFEDQRGYAYLAPTIMFAFVAVYFIILKRTVPRIYYNLETQQFLMVSFNIYNPFKMNKFFFTAGEAVKMDVGEVTAMLGNALVRNRKVILFEKYFKLPIYSNVMFGYESKDALKSFEDNEDPDAVFWSKRN